MREISHAGMTAKIEFINLVDMVTAVQRGCPFDSHDSFPPTASAYNACVDFLVTHYPEEFKLGDVHGD